MGFSATDGRGISVAETNVLLCDCKNGGTCDYSNIVAGSNLVSDKFAVSWELVASYAYNHLAIVA